MTTAQSLYIYFVGGNCPPTKGFHLTANFLNRVVSICKLAYFAEMHEILNSYWKSWRSGKMGPNSLTHTKSFQAPKWNNSAPTYKDYILFVTFQVIPNSIHTVKLGVSRHLLSVCSALLCFNPTGLALWAHVSLIHKALGEGVITTITRETAMVHWLRLQNPYQKVFSR